MILKWFVFSYAAVVEAITVLILTIPSLDGLRKGHITATRNLLKPFLSVMSFYLFLFIDIYWKYETRPSCHGNSCCTIKVMDVFAVKQACKSANEHALKNGPIILEMDTYRYHGDYLLKVGPCFRQSTDQPQEMDYWNLLGTSPP
ncbi:hypothetical protein ACFX1X_022861 [Malus domestica]